MRSKHIYAVAGLLAFAVADLLINLLAAAIQQRSFADQFGPSSTAWLAGLSIVGLLLGYWLSTSVQLPEPPPVQSTHVGKRKTVTVTRLRALLSYARLRGRGIHLSDILLFGSRIDIDSDD